MIKMDQLDPQQSLPESSDPASSVTTQRDFRLDRNARRTSRPVPRSAVLARGAAWRRKRLVGTCPIRTLDRVRHVAAGLG